MVHLPAVHPAEPGAGSLAGSVWQSVLARGLAGLVFGMAALLWPGPVTPLPVIVLGTWLLADALLAAPALLRSPGGWAQRMARLLILGLQAAAAALAMLLPQTGFVWILLMAALWLLTTGSLQFVLLTMTRAWIDRKVWLAVGASMLMMVGVLTVVDPLVAGSAVMVVAGATACGVGAMLSLLALRLRRRARGQPTPGADHATASAPSPPASGI